MKNLLITCGLPYSNGNLHIGHIAGCYLPADIYVRFQRLNGRNVRFICGSDDHGVPIKLTADKEGIKPEEVASKFNKAQKADFSGMGINFDIYGSTAENPVHTKTSQDFFLKLYQENYFKKKSSKQFFDPEAKMFLPDRYVKGTCEYCNAKNQNSDQCEECGKVLDVDSLKEPYSVLNNSAAQVKDTFHWYLDLSKFQTEVANWLEKATTREQTKNFVNGLISTGLVERSMTRDLDWGIPLPIEDPDAKGKVLYVWFDAPIGYISNTINACKAIDGDGEKYTDWWKSPDTEIFHFIGEDNTIFHCIIWIAMLSAEGTFQLPTGVIVNQFLNFKKPGEEAEKISKSRGTAVWIKDFLAEGNNPDSLRFYLTSIAPEKARTVFAEEDLIQKHNSELANTLGNLVNRIFSIYIKNYGTEIKYEQELDLEKLLKRMNPNITTELAAEINNFNFKAAQEKLFDFIRAGNACITEDAPWTVLKTDREKAKTILLEYLNIIQMIAVMLQPFLPFTSAKILQMYGYNKEEISKGISWDLANALISNGRILNQPEILFTKIEKESE